MKRRVSEKKMKYDLRQEFQKYCWIHLPTQPRMLKTANALMPVIQRGRKLDSRLQSRKIKIGECCADLIWPKSRRTGALLIYYHGGGFLMKAAAYHKNLAQTYALRANCAVLFVDYRLAPEYRFPVSVKDSFRAYSWALKNFSFDRLAIGGDSAGADLTMSVMLLAKRWQMRMPDGQMLIYPGCAGDPATESMRRYTDTPLWNSVLNQKTLELYGDEKDYQNPLFRPILTDSFSGFPKAYIETAEFDCLHDAGIQIAECYRKDGVPVIWNDTKGTMHGYDIAEKSPYVWKQVEKRIQFIKSVFRGAV